jgi:hypothetical protein
MKHSIFTLALISLLFSCKKENSVDLLDHTEVRGRLLDASTGEPIEGGTVYLVQGAGWVIFDSVVTTANGEYAFVYDHVLNSHADIWAKAPNYLSNRNIATWSAQYPNGGATSRDFVRENGRVNHQDVHLPPVGYVKYHFKQVHPFSGGVEVRFTPYDSRSVVSWNGNGLDRTYTSVFPGGTKYRIGYAILRNGVLDEQRYDSLYIPRFDTLTYYVEF